MISAFFFIYFFVAGLWTANALRRPVAPTSRFPPLWLPGMVVSELALPLLALRIVVAALFIWGGALDRPVGVAGLVLFGLGLAGLIVVFVRSVKSARLTGHAPSLWTLHRFREGPPAMTDIRNEVEYWDGLSLDIMRRPDVTHAPTLIYVHPGSWMRGRPGRQARPMFHRLVERGWIILDIRYPLSPDATFPDHLIGVKRAISWARSTGADLGVDPHRIAISGGSSGAHLAALAALTADRHDLQAGFTEADVSVMACVPFYGIYDLLIRNPTRYDWPFIAQYVMKSRPHEAPQLYELGSPVDQVRGDAPPFLVVHGEFDSIVLSAESRHFVQALTDVGGSVEYLEVRWAQHGFDAFASYRARAVGARCADWLDRLAQATNSA